MGRENTITTGNVGGKRVARTTSGLSNTFSNSRNLKPSPYDYGVVTYYDTSNKAIFYTPVEDNQSFTKPGQALPLYPNSLNPPTTGSIVPLLRAPDNNIAVIGQSYNKVTYYLDPIGVNSTVNNNTVDITSTNTPTIPAKVELNKEELINNAKAVKDFLKSKGLTKEQAAGIMGNIQAESCFNPTAGTLDLNNAVSYGLIQWNAKYFSFDLIGNTVESQMNALFNPDITRAITPFLEKVKSKPTETADVYAFIFAEEVERCFACTDGFEVYKSGKQANNGKTYKPYKRSEFALDFMNKFNSTTDPLVW
jgi:hypothetical protein